MLPFVIQQSLSSADIKKDKSLIHDEWKDFGVAMKDETRGIAGHEGAGVVVALGEGAEKRWKVGDRAGIKWIASTCFQCDFCLDGTNEVLILVTFVLC